jgi:hypothetical protein
MRFFYTGSSTGHFKKHTSVTKSGQLNNFSVLCLNIRSIVNKFDMLKQLIKSTQGNFEIIGLEGYWQQKILLLHLKEHEKISRLVV